MLRPARPMWRFVLASCLWREVVRQGGWLRVGEPGTGPSGEGERLGVNGEVRATRDTTILCAYSIAPRVAPWSR